MTDEIIEPFYEGEKLVGLDSETNEVVIRPGLFDEDDTRIPRDDFLNICSDFAFKYIGSSEFAEVAKDYLKELEVELVENKTIN